MKKSVLREKIKRIEQEKKNAIKKKSKKRSKKND